MASNGPATSPTGRKMKPSDLSARLFARPGQAPLPQPRGAAAGGAGNGRPYLPRSTSGGPPAGVSGSGTTSSNPSATATLGRGTLRFVPRGDKKRLPDAFARDGQPRGKARLDPLPTPAAAATSAPPPTISARGGLTSAPLPAVGRAAPAPVTVTSSPPSSDEDETTAPPPPLLSQTQRIAARELPEAGASRSGEDLVDMAELQQMDLLEVAHYMRQHGARVGFLYMAPRMARSSIEHHAYNLKVVPHGETDPSDFYTISAGGLTHVQNGQHMFTPLERFEQELEFFSRLSAIPTFYNFRMWKAFAVWRKNVINTKRRQQVATLQENLFVLNGDLRPTLLRVRALCLDIVEMRLCRIDPTKTYTLEQFVQAQREQVAKVAKQLHSFRTDVHRLVLQTCYDTLARIGFAEKPRLPIEHDGFVLPPSPTKTMADDDDEDMTYTQQAAKRSRCQRLTSFIRLVDLLVANAMHSLDRESVEFLQQHLGTLERSSWVDAAHAEEAEADAVDEDEAEAKEHRAGADKTSSAADAKMELRDHISTVQLGDGQHLAVRRPQRRRSGFQPSSHAAAAAVAAAATKKKNEAAPVEIQPLFQVELLVEPEQLYFEPSKETLVAQIRTIISLFEDSAVGIVPLLTDEHFEVFTRPFINDRIEDSSFGESEYGGGVRFLSFSDWIC